MGKILFPRREVHHRPGALEMVLGALRVGGVLVLAGIGAILVLAAVLVPGRVAGARPAQWLTVAIARTFLAITGVRLAAPPARDIRGHHGLVFINHLTYLDPVIVYARGPVRFLAAAGLRTLPFVGQIAMAVGTVFVNRGSRESRAASRRRIRETLERTPAPPVTLAPEGQIGPGGGVLPFRRGAFEVSVETGLPILPLVLAYDPFDAVIWHQKELLLIALWRLTARRGGVRATIIALPVITPGAAGTEEEIDAEAARLAALAEAEFGKALQRFVDRGTWHVARG